MAQGPSDTILVAIWITLRIWESKVRNPDPPNRRRFVLSECFSCFFILLIAQTVRAPNCSKNTASLLSCMREKYSFIFRPLG